MSIYEYKAKNLSGQEVSMSHYKGQVMLIFNSATHCGFTPQYDDIQRLFDKYHKQGLSVLEFPCNQFGNQAPEDDQEIEQICKVRFGVNYDRFKKVDVNGANALPLFDYLKSQQGFKGFGTNKKVSDKFEIPIVAYSVSGEYSMVKAAAQNGWIDEMKIVMEQMYAMKRAGANAIITYYAKEVAKFLENSEN